MGNCLKTQLKEVVNNNNLEKLGELSIQFIAATVSNVTVTPKEGTSIDIYVDGNYIDGEVSHVDNITSAINFMLSQACILHIKNKYNIKELSIGWNEVNADIENLKYLGNLESVAIHGSGATGDIKNFPSSLKSIEASSNAFMGNLAALNTPSIETLALSGVQDVHNLISGDFAVLGNFNSLTVLSLYWTQVTGTIDGFVSNVYTNRGAGSIRGNGIPELVTFGGQTIPVGYQNFVLSWTNESKISIVFDESAYTKGYSQAEAEAAFPGKTIIRVDA